MSLVLLRGIYKLKVESTGREFTLKSRRPRGEADMLWKQLPFQRGLGHALYQLSEKMKKIRLRSYAEGAWNVTKGVRSIR